MSLIFDPVIDISKAGPAFSAVFLAQQSYVNLLDIINIFYGIDLRNPINKIPCLAQSYMIITKQPDKLKTGIGKTVSLKISHLGYNGTCFVAFVQLKNNFTDNLQPHIVLSKPQTMTRYEVSVSLSENLISYKIVNLPTPYKIHGKIGIMSGSMDEAVKFQKGVNILDTTGSYVFINNVPAGRPETTLSVDNFAPPETDKIQSETQKQEYYQGCLIHSGKRGGKYIIKDGKKRYLTEATIAEANKNKEEVIYNVNFLEEAKDRAP
jgi:hypothetical protein